MKKILALVLACVMCLSFCACGASEEVTLYEKYENVITALENEDYEGAVSEIYNLYQSSDKAKEDQAATDAEEAESEAAQKELEEKQLATIAGEWIPTNYYAEDFEATPATIGTDYTATFNGESYTFEVNYVTENGINLLIKDGDTKLYGLDAYLNDNGLYTLNISKYEDEYSSSTLGTYCLASQHTKIDLTADNFFDYFEPFETVTPSKNEFDEVEGLRIYTYYKLKDENGKVNSNISKVAIEYSYEYTWKFVEADFDAGTYTLGESSGNGKPTESSNTTNLSELYDLESYGLILDSESISKKAEKPTISVNDNYQVVRVAGSMYLYTPAE